MITQREADRRVFQRKQDALHKELRAFVEEMSGGAEGSAVTAHSGLVRVNYGDTDPRGDGNERRGRGLTRSGAATKVQPHSAYGTPAPKKADDGTVGLEPVLKPGPLTIEAQPWHMRCWP